jgi:hypothetical protein
MAKERHGLRFRLGNAAASGPESRVMSLVGFGVSRPVDSSLTALHRLAGGKDASDRTEVSVGMLKTDHLAVVWSHNETPPCGRSALEWLLECAGHTQHLNIREEFKKRQSKQTAALTKRGPLSGVVEKPDGRERRRAKRGGVVHSPGQAPGNGIRHKYCAFFGIVREERLDAELLGIER